MGDKPQVVTKEQVAHLCSLLNSAGISPATASRGQISKALGVSDRRARTLQGHLKNGAQGAATEVNEVKGDSWTISLPKTSIHTLDELLAYCKADLTEWYVERFVVNKWEVGAKDNKGEIAVQPLFQVKAWLKKKTHVTDAKAEIAALKEAAKKSAKEYTPIKHKSSPDSGYCLEISIPDLHAGKLTLNDETGHGDFDIDAAIKVFEEALGTLVARSSGFIYEEVIFVVGNDLFHVDGRNNATSAGTVMDVSGNYHSNFVRVREMITKAIHQLRFLAKVKVVVVSGNHDAATAWHLGDSLECTFANCPDVVIDNRPRARKYHQFGKVMLMWTHGHRGNHKEYPLMMATEEPEMFGATTHREAHVGHKHQLKLQETYGVKVRTSPALCPSDKWHADNAFVGMERSAEAHIYQREEGMVGTVMFTVPTVPKS